MPTISQRADAALTALESYQRAHVNMAAAAELVVELTADGTMTAVEGLQALADFVKQYRARLAALDGRAGT